MNSSVFVSENDNDSDSARITLVGLGHQQPVRAENDNRGGTDVHPVLQATTSRRVFVNDGAMRM